MPYLGSWKIDDYLTFCCNTHDPDTGVATDADSVPTYRVYEDETATPILTGSTAKLDDANTTGFYSERIQLTAANGFEKGKCYTIYISATVDSDTGTMHHNFQVEAEVDCNTASDLHADLDDGGRLDLLIDAIKAVTDNLPDSGALSDLATILADTNELQTDLTNGGRLDLLIDATLADTNELQTDWTNGGRLDLLIDAIKAITDALTAAAIADAVWDEALAAHDSEDTTGNVLNDLTEESGGTYRFTSAAIQSTLGAGAITFTYTLTSSVDSAAVADAQVWVTSDLAGSNVLASGTTDANGQVVFYLDAGTVYVWRQKSGWNFTNPDTETVS